MVGNPSLHESWEGISIAASLPSSSLFISEHVCKNILFIYSHSEMSSFSIQLGYPRSDEICLKSVLAETAHTTTPRHG